jgi:MFS family permease
MSKHNNNNNLGDSKTIGLLPVLMFLLAASFYFYEFFLQISPGVMTKELMRDLHLDAAALGTISAFYYYSYTAFQIPAGLLYDRFGARTILTCAVLVCATGALLFGATNVAGLAAAGRLLMGAGSAFAFVGSLYLILHWFPARYFPIFAGLTQFLGSAGALGGNAPLALLTHHYGWHKIILTMSVVGFGLAIVMFLFVRNNPKQCEKVTRSRKSASMLQNLLTVLKTPQTWPIAFYSCLIWAPVAAFAGLWGVPFLAAKYDVSTLHAASLIMWIWVGVGLGAPFIGWLSQKIGRRCLPNSMAALLGVISTLVVIYLPCPQWVTCLFLFGFGLASTGQSLSFAIITDIQPISSASAAIGFNNMAVVAGAIVLQPLAGHILDAHWTGAMINGAHVYDMHAYSMALIALPICYAACWLISVFSIRETHCISHVNRLD